MDQKTIAWVSYLTIIGWIIALVSYNGSTSKSPLAKFHLRQSFGLNVLGLALSVIARFLPASVAMVISVLSLVLFVLWILGLIAAVKGEEKSTPVLGSFFQNTFTFIS